MSVLIAVVGGCALAQSGADLPAYMRPKSDEGILIAFCTPPRVSVPLCQSATARKRILESTGGSVARCDSVVWQTFLLALKVDAVGRTGAKECAIARVSNPALLEARPTAEDPNRKLYIPKPGATFKTKSGTPRCIVFVSSISFIEKPLGGGFRGIELKAVYALWDTKYNAVRSAGQSSDAVSFAQLSVQDLEDLAKAFGKHLFGDVILTRW